MHQAIQLAASRTVDALLAPLDLYRPDQPRDSAGRFTADPGGNMRTQIRKHGTRADFHERKAADHRAKGNAKMAQAHEKLAASHRDIAQGLHLEHSLKYGSGPQPTADFVPGKKAERQSHSARDWESFDKAAGKGEQKPEAKPAEQKQNYFDHLAQAKKAANSTGKSDDIAAHNKPLTAPASAKPPKLSEAEHKAAINRGFDDALKETPNASDFAAKAKFHSDREAANRHIAQKLRASDSAEDQAKSSYHEGKARRHAMAAHYAKQAAERSKQHGKTRSKWIKLGNYSRQDNPMNAITLSTGRTVYYDLASSDGDGHWVTIDGVHVFIKGGEITKGPAGMVGKTPLQAAQHRAGQHYAKARAHEQKAQEAHDAGDHAMASAHMGLASSHRKLGDAIEGQHAPPSARDHEEMADIQRRSPRYRLEKHKASKEKIDDLVPLKGKPERTNAYRLEKHKAKKEKIKNLVPLP